MVAPGWVIALLLSVGTLTTIKTLVLSVGLIRWGRILKFFLFATAGSALILSLNLSDNLSVIVVSFVPLAAALVVLLLRTEPIVLGLSLHVGFSGWWIFAWQLPTILALATIQVDIWMPGVTYARNFEGVVARISRDIGPEQAQETKEQLESYSVHPLLSTLTNALMFGPTVYSLLALGEEAAWRGFLLREFAPLGFWRASLMVGLSSGLWRGVFISVLQFPGQPLLGIALTTAISIAASPLATLIQWKTHSVLASSIFRGVSNAAGSLDQIVIMVAAGHDHWAGSTGIAGLIVYASIALIIWKVYGNSIRPTVLDTWCKQNKSPGLHSKKQNATTHFAEEVD